MTNRNPAPEPSGDFKTEMSDALPKLRGFVEMYLGNFHAADVATMAAEQVIKGIPRPSAGETLPALIRAAVKICHDRNIHAGYIESSGEVKDALHALPGEQRAAIILYSCMNMSYADIAHLQGKSVGTMKSRINRARAAMLVRMGEDTIGQLMAAA